MVTDLFKGTTLTGYLPTGPHAIYVSYILFATFLIKNKDFLSTLERLSKKHVTSKWLAKFDLDVPILYPLNNEDVFVMPKAVDYFVSSPAKQLLTSCFNISHCCKDQVHRPP